MAYEASHQRFMESARAVQDQLAIVSQLLAEMIAESELESADLADSELIDAVSESKLLIADSESVKADFSNSNQCFASIEQIEVVLPPTGDFNIQDVDLKDATSQFEETQELFGDSKILGENYFGEPIPVDNPDLKVVLKDSTGSTTCQIRFPNCSNSPLVAVISNSSLPPPKPPDQSFQKILMAFQVICNIIMLPPPPKPPYANLRAVVITILPSCVEIADSDHRVFRDDLVDRKRYSNFVLDLAFVLVDALVLYVKCSESFEHEVTICNIFRVWNAHHISDDMPKVVPARCLMKFQENVDNVSTFLARGSVLALLTRCEVLRNLSSVKAVHRFMVKDELLSMIILVVKSKQGATQLYSLEYFQNVENYVFEFKLSMEVGVASWYYDLTYIILWDNDSVGALFLHTKGWVQEVFKEKCGKKSIEKITSFIIGSCKPIMLLQHESVIPIMGVVFLTLELEILNHLPSSFVTEPCQNHFLSYWTDISHDDALEMVGLFYFPITTFAVAVPKGMPIAMALSLAIYMEKIEHVQAAVTDLLGAKHHGTSFFIAVTRSFMIYVTATLSYTTEALVLFCLFWSIYNERPHGYILAKTIEACLQWADLNPSFVNLIASKTMVFTKSASYQIVDNKASSLLNCRHQNDNYIGKFDETKKVAAVMIFEISLHVQVFVYTNLDAIAEKSLATNIASSPSAIFVSMIHDWLNKIKWSTSIGDIYYAIFAGSNLSTRKWKGSHRDEIAGYTLSGAKIKTLNLWYKSIVKSQWNGRYFLSDFSLALQPNSLFLFMAGLSFLMMENQATTRLHMHLKSFAITDWHIAWVYTIVRSMSSAQRQNSQPVKHLQFKQWDPGKLLLFGKVKLMLDDTLEDAFDFMKTCLHHNLEDKVDFNGGSNVMIQNST